MNLVEKFGYSKNIFPSIKHMLKSVLSGVFYCMLKKERSTYQRELACATQANYKLTQLHKLI